MKELSAKRLCDFLPKITKLQMTKPGLFANNTIQVKRQFISPLLRAFRVLYPRHTLTIPQLERDTWGRQPLKRLKIRYLQN